MPYSPIPGDWHIQECQDKEVNEGKLYYLFWQWRQGAWEFSERINDEIEAGNLVENLQFVAKDENYAYWR